LIDVGHCSAGSTWYYFVASLFQRKSRKDCYTSQCSLWQRQRQMASMRCSFVFEN